MGDDVRLRVTTGTLERSASSGAIWGDVWLDAGGLASAFGVGVGDRADLEDVDLLRRQLAAMETGVWRG